MLKLVPPWAWAIAGALVLAAAFASGFKVASWKCEAAKTRALEQAQKQFDKRLAEANRAAADYVQSRARGQAESRQRETTIREVFRDVEVPADCAAPPAVRSVLRDAVRAANGAPAAEPGAAVPPAS